MTVLAGALAAPASARADDWPSRGFDAAHLGASTERSGASFRAGSWKFIRTGSFWNTSSPAIADGIVVFGMRDGTVQALRASTGRRLWQFTTGDSVIASPAIRQGRVFVSSLDGKLYALRLVDGSVAWTKTLGGLEQSSPTVVGDSIIVAGGLPSRKVFRIDAGTGQTLWESPPTVMAQFSNSAAVSDGDQVLVGAMEGHLYSFDLATGALRWTYEADGMINLSAPVIAGDRAYLLPGGSSRRLHAVTLATGQSVPGWPVELPSPSPDGDLPGQRLNRALAVSSLTFIDGRLVFDVRFDDAVDSDADFVADQFLLREFLMAASPDDGSILWQQGNGRRILGSPNDIPTNWLCPTPAAYPSTKTGSSFLVAASSLLPTVQILDASTGANRSSVTADAPSRVSPALANGRLFLGTESGAFQSNLSSTNHPPDAPLLKGAEGRRVGAVNTLIEWSPALDPEGDAVSYQVRVDRDTEILESWESETIVGAGVTSLRLTRPLQAGQTYAVAVRARDANGAWSDWSAPKFLQAVESPAVSIEGAAQADLASALAGAAAGSVVHLEAGIFYLSETMRVPAGVSLEGAGPGQTILDATGQAVGVSLEGTVEGAPTEIKSLTVTGAKVGIAVGATRGARLKGLIVRDNWDAGVDVSAAGTAELSQGTLAANGCAVRSFGEIAVKNSIVVGNQIGFQGDHPGALISQYNDLTGNAVALRGIGIKSGAQDLARDVTFANYPKRDLHVMPGQASTDQGDPADDATLEPAPNGGRVNLGAFGATPEAELSATAPVAATPGTGSKGGEGCSVATGGTNGPGRDLWSVLAALLGGGASLLRRRRAAAGARSLRVGRRSHRPLVAVLGALLLVAAAPSSVRAATCTWNQGSQQNFSGSTSYWSCGHVPVAADDVVFSNSGLGNCVINASISVNSIAINSGYTGTVTQSSGQSITTAGAFSFGASTTGKFVGGNSAINVGGAFSMLGAAGSAFTSTSGMLNIGGAFTKTGGTFTHGSGRVVLASTAATNTFATGGATFNDLYINDGLVGYWKLDDTSIGVGAVADSSGYGLTGDHLNAPTSSTSVLPSVTFDDTRSVLFAKVSAQAINLGAMTADQKPSAITMAAWIKTTAVDSAGSEVISGGDGYAIRIQSTQVQVVKHTAAGWYTCTGTPGTSPTNGSWHHVAGTVDSTQMVVYFDGVALTTCAEANALDHSRGTNLFIGRHGNGGTTYDFDGYIDDVRLYSRVLSASTIALLAGGSQPATGVATQTVTGNPIVLGDLVISSGTLAAGNTTITVGDSWLNDGGIFSTGTSGLVTMNGSGTGRVIRASGYDFNSLTISGTGSWTMTDPVSLGVTIDNDFSISSGTLTSTAGRLTIGGSFNRTGGTFTPNNGTVMLTATTAKTFSAGTAASFNDLIINDGLVGYWKLDETSGTNAEDSSGNGNDGTYTNSPTHSSTVPGVSFTDARSVALNGTTQCVQLGNANDMNITGPITMAAWVYNTDSTPYNDILAHGYTQSPNAGVQLRVVAGRYECGTFNGSDYLAVYSIGTADLNSWVHLACTYDGAAWNLYRNGTLVNSLTTAVGPVTVAANWAIGSRGTCGARFFNGSIDDVRFYNRALGATEVSGLAIGNQPGTASGTYTMTGSATVAGDLVIASGKLAAGTSSITVAGNWLNYGGLFTASSSGLVTFNGSASTNVILSAGQTFGGVTVNGTGTWTLADRLELNPASALTMTAGALSLSSYTLRGGNVDKNGVAVTPSTGKVVLDGNASATTDQGAFTNLRVEPVAATNLVGYWKLDAGEGPTARDFSASGNDGTLTNGPQWVDTGLPSAISFDNPSAVAFDGTNDYIDMGATATPTNAAYSACAWVKMTSVSGYQAFLSEDGTTVSGFTMMRRGDTSTFALTTFATDSTSPTQVNATGSTVPVAGTWYHVCGTYDSANIRLYVNGALEATTAKASAFSATGHSIIGAGKYNGSRSDYFNGTIDDVRIYNVALTAAQIAALASGTYPAGLAGTPTYTLGAATTVSGTLAIDNGTLATGAYTLNATATGTPATVNSGTYSVGSTTNTFAGGLTVNKYGTLDLPTSGGTVAIGSTKNLNVDGTLSASSAGAVIQTAGGAGTYYNFNVGATAFATPTLNINGLQVKNTTANGMYINPVTTSTTTFTRFDSIAFSSGTTGGRLLQIYAPSLNLVSNGCSFDSSVSSASKTTAYNVTLRGDGSATETRALFGNATCFSGNSPSYAQCEAFDDDDDAGNDGVGDNAGSNAAVAQWVKAGKVDTNGTIEGFPTTAFDWSTFTYYSTYVVYHDVDGTTGDRLYVRDTNGSAKSGYATPYWDGPVGEDIVGTPRFDTVSSVHYVYLATSAGHVYRLIDNTSSGTLSKDNSGSWAGANNPYDCSCAITTPLALDANNVYWGGTASGNKVWTLGKTNRTLASSSPVTVTNVISGATPALWTSGDTYIFMGSNATFYKIDVTTQTLTSNNASPVGTVNGRISVISNRLYGADNAGWLWVLDPSNITTPLWSYHDNTNHNGCTSGQSCAITSSLYVDPTYARAFYGDSDGHLYASYNSSGTTGAQWVAGYPFRPGTASDVYATAPLYNAGILVAGTTTGSIYVIDVNGGSGPVLKQTYQLGSATKVSGIAYDRGSASYMVSTSNAASKDGKLVYIDAMTDPTSSSP